MIVTIDKTSVINKMTALCQELLEQASYQELRAMIDEFLQDERAVAQYQAFQQHQQQLEDKERQQIKLTEEEITAYEQEEMAIYENTIIRKYLYAENEINKLFHLINQFFTKTIEWNRVPELSEIKKDGCGCGGGCGGH